MLARFLFHQAERGIPKGRRIISLDQSKLTEKKSERQDKIEDNQRHHDGLNKSQRILAPEPRRTLPAPVMYQMR
jgi:hypothetical protein